MRRTKEWYNTLTPEERSRLVELETSQYPKYDKNTDSYICGVEGCTEQVEFDFDDGGVLCDKHQEERMKIIEKANREMVSLGFPDTEAIRSATNRFKELLKKYVYTKSNSLTVEEQKLKNSLIEFSNDVLDVKLHKY